TLVLLYRHNTDIMSQTKLCVSSKVTREFLASILCPAGTAELLQINARQIGAEFGHVSNLYRYELIWNEETVIDLPKSVVVKFVTLTRHRLQGNRDDSMNNMLISLNDNECLWYEFQKSVGTPAPCLRSFSTRKFQDNYGFVVLEDVSQRGGL